MLCYVMYTYRYMYTYIYIYTYVCVYVCACVCLQAIAVCVEQLGRWYMMACPCYSLWTKLLVLFWLWYLWPNLKPSVLRSLVVLTSDIQDPRQKLSSVIWNDSWILICYAFCWRKAVWWDNMWPSMQMWASWQQVDEKVSLIDTFQRKEMFLEVFCLRICLVWWFPFGWFIVLVIIFSSRDSWLAPLVNSRQACEVIW